MLNTDNDNDFSWSVFWINIYLICDGTICDEITGKWFRHNQKLAACMGFGLNGIPYVL